MRTKKALTGLPENRGYPKISFFIVLSFLFLLQLIVVYAEVEGPTTLDVENSSRRTAQGVSTLNAYAGNVTQLNIIAISATQTWQAYYGNISGILTLDDASGHTIFDWQLNDPEGEIYASEKEINFDGGNIACYDYGHGADVNYLEIFEYMNGSIFPPYDGLGQAIDDPDAVNKTFVINDTHQNFYVGTTFINGSVSQVDGGPACPVARLYNYTNQTTAGRFEEVLLYDDSAGTDMVIYTAILEEGGAVGFDGRRWDFQMIVADNGHDGDTDTTTYYFYVELE